MYISRDIEKVLLEAAESFQVITLYGSRQVGKTTTVDVLFGDDFEFVTLDDADELADRGLCVANVTRRHDDLIARPADCDGTLALGNVDTNCVHEKCSFGK